MKRKLNPMPDVRDWFPDCKHGPEHQELVRKTDGNFNVLCTANSMTQGSCYERGPSINLPMLNDLVLATKKEQQ